MSMALISMWLEDQTEEPLKEADTPPVICLVPDPGVAINLGKFDHDLTSRPSPGIMVSKGNHPQIALFQVKYYNLRR